MCPLCVGAATILISGTTSASGIALVLLRKHFPKARPNSLPQFPLAAENPAVPRNGACATVDSSVHRSAADL